MTKGWTYHNTREALDIFVSSRIHECSEERAIIKKVISSLFHKPIVFEDVGARDYPPRDLYLSKLHDSHIMIGIYKLGYGFIADDLEISGLEDEYRYSCERNIPSIFYIYRKDEGREPRLTLLLEEISKGKSTVSYYEEPKDLKRRVGRDITALITERYLEKDIRTELLLESPENVLNQANSAMGSLIERPALNDQILKGLESNFVVCLYGPTGSGKTTLAAGIAYHNQGIYIQAAGLAPKDLFFACVTAITSNPLINETDSLDNARSLLVKTWLDNEVTLIVDDCEFIDELKDTLEEGAEFSHSKRLLYAQREHSKEDYSISIPEFTLEEIQTLLSENEDLIPSNVETKQNLDIYGVKELFFKAKTSFNYDGLLKIKGPLGEVLRYLALSSIPLSVEQTLFLIGNDAYRVNDLFEDIKTLGFLIEDSPRGLFLNDPKSLNILNGELNTSIQLKAFYLNRLVNLSIKEGNFRRTYELATQLGDESNKKYINDAAYEAIKFGDWKLGVSLLDKMLENALDHESKYESFRLLLWMIYPVELMGHASRANDLMNKAGDLAKSLGEDAQLQLREVELSSKARRSIASNDVNSLIEIYDYYKDENKLADQARIGIELSAIYIQAKDYEKACEIVRPSLEIFLELEDEYGIDIAQRNLVSALSAISGNDQEAESILKAIQDRHQELPDGRRQRAWFCNLQTRRLRRSGRYHEAKLLAKESIAIAEDLGDLALKALNLINLGNVYKDQKLPKLAIKSYAAAAKTSKDCGRLDLEADAARLSAVIFNDFNVIDGYDNLALNAKTQATHAISLFRGGINFSSLGYALMELGEANLSLKNSSAASKAYFEAAKIFITAKDEVDNLEHSLIAASEITLPGHIEDYLDGIFDLFNLEDVPKDKYLADVFLRLIGPIVLNSTKNILIRVLGKHLHTIKSNIPLAFEKALTLAVANELIRVIDSNKTKLEVWRLLHSGIVLCYLLKDRPEPFINKKLATSIASNVPNLSVREEGDGSRLWTVVLNLKQKVTLTIFSLDETHETNLAAFALALFLKSCESELSNELLGGANEITELMISMGRSDKISDTFSKKAIQSLDLDEILKDQACSVSRPTSYDDEVPTMVFLSPKFFNDIELGSDNGGSLQMLFGLTLIELVNQFLRGQIDIEVIKPKVLSLVRKTMP